MDLDNLEQEDKTLFHICMELMLHSGGANSPGLMKGKTGILIFMYEYARRFKDQICESYAEELAMELVDEIKSDMKPYFSDGMAGIVWGMCYLRQKYGVRAVSEEKLAELDLKIMTTDVRRVKDHSLETGLEGLAYYVISRRSQTDTAHVIDDQYVQELIESLGKCKKDFGELIETLNGVMNGYAADTSWLLQNILDKMPDQMQKNNQRMPPLGLNGGYAGIGLKLLLK